MNRIDHSLFEGHPGENNLPDCPACGARLLFKNSKSGPFIGCSDYPQCDFTQALGDHHAVEVIKDIEGGVCPKCSSQLQIKRGRFGLFIGCSNYPQCDYIDNAQDKTDTEVTCPQCKKGKLIEKTNRYGKQFFSCSRYPDCRYVVNFAPIAKPCPKCNWPIMVKKGNKRLCPQKTCRYSEDDD